MLNALFNLLVFFLNIYQSFYFFFLYFLDKFFFKGNDYFLDFKLFLTPIYFFFFYFFSFLFSISLFDFIYLFFFYFLNRFFSTYYYFFLSVFFISDFYFFFCITFCFIFYLRFLFKQYFFYLYNSPSKYIIYESLAKSFGNVFFTLNGFFLIFHNIFIILFIFYCFFLSIQFIYFLKLSSYISCVFLCHELLAADCLIFFVKIFISIFSFLTYIFFSYSNFFYSIKPEFFFTLGISIISLNFLLMSYNLISLFISLEVFSTSIIILSKTSTSNTYLEDSLMKYYTINCLASVFFLFSIVLLYGVCGSFSLKIISVLFLQVFSSSHTYVYLYVCLSLIIFFFSFSFKLILVPFHQWVFDVYSNLPSFILIYLITNSKLVFFTLFYYFLNFIFIAFYSLLINLIILLSFITLFISCNLAFSQIYLRKFLISVSLINTGIILFSLSLSQFDNGLSFFLYLFFDNLFFFSFFIFTNFFYISDLDSYKAYKDISLHHLFFLKNNIFKCFIIIFFLSMSGLPPFGIFFLKFIVLQVLSLTDNFFFFLLIIFFSLLILIIFIRPIKLIFFLNQNKGNKLFNYLLNLKCSLVNYPFIFLFSVTFLLYLNSFFFLYFDFFFYIVDSILFSI